MSKGGVVVLIIAALVFSGLGFVVGQVVSASGTQAGSLDDPVATQSYVDKLFATRTQDMQADIDELYALLGGSSIPGSGTTDPVGSGEETGGETTGGATSMTVRVTSDDVNVRASASIDAEIVAGGVASGTELEYLGSTTSGSDTWYHVRLSNGTEGYVASWLCAAPQ